MSKLAELFLKNTQAQLESQGISQKDLALKMGVHPVAVSKYFTGKNKPGLDMAERFAAALGVQPWELLKPEGAQATPIPKEPGNAELLAAMEQLQKTNENLQKRICELEAKLLTAEQNLKEPTDAEMDELRREVDDFLDPPETASLKKKTKA